MDHCAKILSIMAMVSISFVIFFFPFDVWIDFPRHGIVEGKE
jgi:hypothetical protein